MRDKDWDKSDGEKKAAGKEAVTSTQEKESVNVHLEKERDSSRHGDEERKVREKSVREERTDRIRVGNTSSLGGLSEQEREREVGEREVEEVGKKEKEEEEGAERSDDRDGESEGEGKREYFVNKAILKNELAMKGEEVMRALLKKEEEKRGDEERVEKREIVSALRDTDSMLKD